MREWPILEDSDFPVPRWVEVREGKIEDFSVVAFWSSEHCIHVDIEKKFLDANSAETCLNTLAHAILRKSIGDLQSQVIRKMAILDDWKERRTSPKGWTSKELSWIKLAQKMGLTYYNAVVVV